jgi:hypothetical protein
MFKKLFLSLTIATLSITSLNQCSQEISLQSVKTEIQDLINHIAQEQRTIILEMHKTLTIGEKAINHYKALLKEAYEPLAQKITIVLNNIINSEEFDVSVEDFTDYQLNQIIEKNICFNDINYSEINAEYPVFKKIEDELYKVFPSLDEQTEQLFNIFYVTTANCRGHKLLLHKLDDNLIELRQALAFPEIASNHAIRK